MNADPRHIRATSLPDASRPGPVRLQVADLARSRSFYQGILGLRALPGGDGDARRLRLGPHGGDRLLVELVEFPGAHPVPSRGRLGLYHFALLLPGRSDLGRFVRHLADEHVQVGAADHLVSEALYLKDPDGLGIEVYADRPRDEWETVGGELAMASNRLDLRDLARTAGSTPWSGMPEGSVVGHVHLHVGDLARAEAFYADRMGFDVTVRSYPGALFLSAGGYHHHLGLNTWAADAPQASDDDARLLEWTLLLPDEGALQATAGRLRELGTPVDDAGPGAVRATDPWGTVVRLAVGA